MAYEALAAWAGVPATELASAYRQMADGQQAHIQKFWANLEEDPGAAEAVRAIIAGMPEAEARRRFRVEENGRVSNALTAMAAPQYAYLFDPAVAQARSSEWEQAARQSATLPQNPVMTAPTGLTAMGQPTGLTAMGQPTGLTAGPAPTGSSGAGAAQTFPEQGQSGDDLAAFRAAYRAAQGQDIPEHLLNDIGYLSTLSNEQIRTLPQRLLNGFPTARLAQMSNEDLLPIIRANPHFLGGFSTERLLTFAPDIIRSEFVPFLRQAGATDLAANLEAGIQQGGGSGQGGQQGGTSTGTGTTPTPGVTTPAGTGAGAGTGTTDGGSTLPTNPLIQSLPGRDGMSAGQWNDFSGLTPNSLKYLFPWATQPEFAAENVLESGLGISPRSGNPLGRFMMEQIVPQAQLAGDVRTLYGQDAGELGILGSLGDFFGSGGANTGAPQNFKGDLNTLLNDFTGGELTTRADAERARIRAANPGKSDAELQALYDQNNIIRQAALALSVNDDPTRAFELQTQVGGNTMNPFFRNNRSLMRAVQGNLYGQYMRDSLNDPNRTFFGYMM